MELFKNIRQAVGKEIRKSAKKTLLKMSPADNPKYQDRISTTRTVKRSRSKKSKK